MQDESRHVAFGRLALRDYYPQLTQKERNEREEFLLEACYLMRDRFDAVELWKNLGLPVEECATQMYESGFMQKFRNLAVHPHRADRQGHRAVGPASATATPRWACWTMPTPMSTSCRATTRTSRRISTTVANMSTALWNWAGSSRVEALFQYAQAALVLPVLRLARFCAAGRCGEYDARARLVAEVVFQQVFQGQS